MCPRWSLSSQPGRQGRGDWTCSFSEQLGSERLYRQGWTPASLSPAEAQEELPALCSGSTGGASSQLPPKVRACGLTWALPELLLCDLIKIALAVSGKICLLPIPHPKPPSKRHLAPLTSVPTAAHPTSASAVTEIQKGLHGVKEEPAGPAVPGVQRRAMSGDPKEQGSCLLPCPGPGPPSLLLLWLCTSQLHLHPAGRWGGGQYRSGCTCVFMGGTVPATPPSSGEPGKAPPVLRV